jgi:molybdopterin molybdotransferase
MQAEVLARSPLLPLQDVALREALGLVLADDIVASEDLPAFANSAVDGYAVRAADVAAAPTTLPVLEEVAAGAVASQGLVAGAAIKIMTGAPIPVGADAVVMVEDTEPAGRDVCILVSVEVGAAVRPAGGDVAAGVTVLESGTRIGPAHLGVLASLGVPWPPVRRRPVVAIVSTGDEVVPPETATLGPGKIRDANRFLLRGALEELGAVVIDHGIVPDDAAGLARVLGHAARGADAVVTSGGVSMGEYDVVKLVFAGDGDVAFHRVAMQPAKPLGFGTLDGTPFFGLPGNPVSVVVAFEQFLRPALLHSMGARRLFRPRVRGIIVDDVRTDPAKEVFLRVVTNYQPGSGWEATLSGGQSSNVLSALAAADAFAVAPVGVGQVTAGMELDFEMFRWPATRTREEALDE